MTYLPNQIFAPSKPTPCTCNGFNDFVRPVDRGDSLIFQIPNDFTPGLNGSNKTVAGDFGTSGTFDLWSEGTGNGETTTWSYSSGTAKTTGNSKILNIAFGGGNLEPYHRYKISFDIAHICPGATVKIVLYRTYSGDSSTDFVIIATYDAAGSYAFDYVADDTYTRIGFYVTGDCGEDYTAIDNVVVKAYDYKTDIEFTLFDKDDVAQLTSDITLYDKNGIVSFNTEDVADLPNGCYQICLTSGTLGDNIFVDGNNGDFETDISTCSGENVPFLALSPGGFLGTNCGAELYDWLNPLVTILEGNTQIVLKRKKTYYLEAYVYVDNDGSGFPPFSGPELIMYSSGGANTVIIGQPIINSPQNWHLIKTKVEIGYTDQLVNVEVRTTGNPATHNIQFDIYVKRVRVYEEYETCFDRFEIHDSHCNTVLFEYANNKPAFGFIYPEGFLFAFRTYAALVNPRFLYSEEINKDTNSNQQLEYSDGNTVQLLRLADTVEYVYNAIALMWRHNTVYVDGVRYIKQPGDITPIYKPKTLLASCEIEVTQGQANNKSTNCG